MVKEFLYRFKFALQVVNQLGKYYDGPFQYSKLKPVFSECKILLE